LYERLGGPQGRSGRAGKISPPSGFDTRIGQPVVIHYTNDAISAPIITIIIIIIIRRRRRRRRKRRRL
jgi:hypothetical protein